MSEKINTAIDTFLGKKCDNCEDCNNCDKECVASGKKSKKIKTNSGEIIEHVQKKLVIEDGRELLL
jgi:hypothetical protein